MAPHGAPGAQEVSTDLQLEAKSEKRVRRINRSQSIMGTLRSPVTEGPNKVPGAHRAQSSENSPKSQSARTDRKFSALTVLPKSQIFVIVLCLLFHNSHAGRILMYLPVATRYDSYICSGGIKPFFLILRSHLSAWTPLAGSLAEHGHQVFCLKSCQI